MKLYEIVPPRGQGGTSDLPPEPTTRNWRRNEVEEVAAMGVAKKVAKKKQQMRYGAIAAGLSFWRGGGFVLRSHKPETVAPVVAGAEWPPPASAATRASLRPAVRRRRRRPDPCSAGLCIRLAAIEVLRPSPSSGLPTAPPDALAVGRHRAGAAGVAELSSREHRRSVPDASSGGAGRGGSSCQISSKVTPKVTTTPDTMNAFAERSWHLRRTTTQGGHRSARALEGRPNFLPAQFLGHRLFSTRGRARRL